MAVLAAVTRLLVVLACTVLSVSAHSEPHPLSRVNLGNIRTQLDGGVISIGTSVLHGIGETVNVTFSGISHNSTQRDSQDWIGVWSPRPSNGDYSSIAPTKYKYVTADSTGAGQSDLWLLNSRQEIVVAYFTGGLDSPLLRAESQPIEFENVAMAMHLHLSLTGDVSEMNVDWTSAQDATSSPWVRWGVHPKHLNNTVNEVRL